MQRIRMIIKCKGTEVLAATVDPKWGYDPEYLEDDGWELPYIMDMGVPADMEEDLLNQHTPDRVCTGEEMYNRMVERTVPWWSLVPEGEEDTDDIESITMNDEGEVVYED